MKNKLLAAAIATTATIATSQASAGILSHDFYQSLGDQQFHYVISNGSLYEISAGSNTSEVVENQTLRVHYRSPGEGITNRNLSCSEPNGDHTEGLPESWRAEEVNTYLSLAGGQTTENSDLNGFFCDIDIGPQGEVLGGWVQNTDVEFSGLSAPIHSIIQMDVPRRTTAYFGTTCDDVGNPGGPPVSITTAIATNALFDQLMEDNGSVAGGELDGPGSPPKPTGCTTFGITQVVIGQCDPLEADTNACIANIAKSVPVPAFAAAALGLGLLGITYLTSRRRRQS